MTADEILQEMAEEAEKVGEHGLSGDLSTLAFAMRMGNTSRALQFLSQWRGHAEERFTQSKDYATRSAAAHSLFVYNTAKIIIRGVRKA